ncbi:MAG TPA: c-type cytochrome [Azospira sp.]|nr:c-type cytochrome [Azospira sp.]
MNKRALSLGLGLAALCSMTSLPAAAEPAAPAKAGTPAAVTAAAPAPYFAANCFNCHGTDGRSHAAIPALAGKEAAYIAESMKGFKDGSRPATIMHQLAKGYTDEEIAVLADYFAKQKN